MMPTKVGTETMQLIDCDFMHHCTTFLPLRENIPQTLNNISFQTWPISISGLIGLPASCIKSTLIISNSPVNISTSTSAKVAP